jgi:signal transduction histidine kinase
MLPLAKEDIELLPFATKLVEERAQRIKDSGIALDLRGDKGSGRVTGDRRRLSRALGHLIDNAIAATPRGGRILVELTRHKVRGKDKARIVISDNGPGMDTAALARALGGLKNSAGGKSSERRQGLGLPLARQLIEAHGGKLELMSEPGQGTAAIVELV